MDPSSQKTDLARYMKNQDSISPGEQEMLWNAHVLVAGAGGLGGFLIEMLARVGIGRLTIVDGDRFEPSNLNRQLLALEGTMGRSKAEVAGERVRSINGKISCSMVPEFLTEEGFVAHSDGVHLVADALGGLAAHLALLHACRKTGLPLVTGSVAGWTGIAATVLAGSPGPELLWQGTDRDDAEKVLGSLAPVAALVASVQCTEIIRFLTGKRPALGGRLQVADLQSMAFDVLEL